MHFFASPGFLAEPMSIFLANDIKAGEAQPEADEVIAKRFFPLSRAVNMVMNGKIKDAKTIAGVMWLAQSRGGPKLRR